MTMCGAKFSALKVRCFSTNNFRWCDHVECYLIAIGLDHHLTEEAPTGDARKIKVWKMEEFLIINWMKKAMEPNIALTMCGFTSQNSCKEIWDNVQSMYSKDRTKLHELWVKLIRLEQGSMSVAEYTDIFLELYHELKRALPINDEPEHMKKLDEMLHSFCFLQGLKPEWEPFVYQILREAELPPWYTISRRVIALEHLCSSH